MNSIKRYFPGFVDTDEAEHVTVPFSTLTELVEIPWVKSWSTSPRFHRFAQTKERQRHLMAVFDADLEWWVVGILAGEVAELPEWTGGKYLAIMPDGQKVCLDSSHVSMSCGDRLTLKDGQVARWVR